MSEQDAITYEAVVARYGQLRCDAVLAEFYRLLALTGAPERLRSLVGRVGESRATVIVLRLAALRSREPAYKGGALLGLLRERPMTSGGRSYSVRIT